MPEFNKKITEFDAITQSAPSDITPVVVADSGVTSGYANKKITEGNRAKSYVNSFEYTQELNTTSKTICGAINEIFDLIPSVIEETVFPVVGGGE